MALAAVRHAKRKYDHDEEEEEEEGARAPAAKKPDLRTAEQSAVIGTRLGAATGVRYLEVPAYAGTGKSTTLNKWAAADGAPMLDLLFNRGMADQAAGAASANMVAKTWHQIPFMFLMGKDKEGYALATKAGAEDGDRASDVDNAFKVKMAQWVKKQRGLLPALMIEQEHTFWAFVMSTLRAFCKSGHHEVEARDLYHLERMIQKQKQTLAQRSVAGAGAGAGTAGVAQRRLKWLPEPADVQRVTQAVVTAIVDRELLEINFDVALKLVHLKGIKLHTKWRTIAMDEAQDVNEVMLEIIKNQIAECNLIAVGDERQAINQWNNTVDAMKLLRPFYQAHQRVKLPLTETFRFGQQLVDAINYLFHCFEPLETPLVTNVPTPTELLVTPPTTAALVRRIMYEVQLAPHQRVGVLSRTKAGAIELVEHFLSQVDVAASPAAAAAAGAPRERLKFACCASIRTALSTIARLAQMTDAQLVQQLGKAEEDENQERADTIEMLLARNNRKRYARDLQTVMALQTGVDQCNVFLTTGHSAKGDEFHVTFLTGDFEKPLEELVAGKKEYEDAVEAELLRRRAAVKASGIPLADSVAARLAHEARANVADERGPYRTNTAELNLLYVAISRARLRLYLPSALHAFLTRRPAIKPAQQTLAAFWKPSPAK